MSEFAYVRAHSLNEALMLPGEPGLRSRVLAGGTDLVNQFRQGDVSCDRVVDVPEIEASYIGTDFPEGPYGAKNLAEPVLLATAPAIANAVFHAAGVRLHTLPVTLERELLGHDLRSGRGESACRRVLAHTRVCLTKPGWR